MRGLGFGGLRRGLTVTEAMIVSSFAFAILHLSIPSLEETIRRAPARERDGAHHYQQGYWPGIGTTDPWPAARIGYPGHEVRRVYA